MNRTRIAVMAAVLAGVLGSTAAMAGQPARCKAEDALQIRGDVPGAISFDVYSQLQPMSAKRLALFESTGEVKHLADGLTVCEIADDGVADPSAVLVHVPHGQMAYWVSAANVETAD